ncbi:MAG: hypothetical protein JWL84_23 [Rhodospirillales bacterium]|nr:hypothetical protein [Rhodospirillales bacterium]
MAVMFPQRLPGDSIDPSGDAAAVFSALQAELDDEWYVFHDRELTVEGEQRGFDFILLHREHGIAILAVDLPDEEIDAPVAIAVIRRFLEEQGFPALFAKPPAIVVLGVVPPFAAFEEVLASRFAAAPRTRPSDPDWVEWLADRLTVTNDLASEPMIAPPEGIVVEAAQPEFRHVQPLEAKIIDVIPDTAALPRQASIAANDRGLVRALGVLTLFGVLVGAVALAASGVSRPPPTIGALAPVAAADTVAAPSAAAADPPEPAPAMTEAAVPDDPQPEGATKPAARNPVHKPHRKRQAARHPPREKSFWDRVASIFH